MFSKFIFWLENLVHLLSFLLYELMLVPLIYLQMIFGILKSATFPRSLILACAWLLTGLFYLLYCVVKDLLNFLQILYDYKEEGDEETTKQQEDDMQDKIVIYNEIIDTLRAIMNYFRYRRSQLVQKKKEKRGKHDYNKVFGVVKNPSQPSIKTEKSL